MHPFIAVLLGTITGVGGGTIRDMFLARIPTVLRADVYATAAMAGSAVMITAAEGWVCLLPWRLSGRRGLFWATAGERLATLESAEGCGMTSATRPIDRETAGKFSCSFGGASSATTTCAFGASAWAARARRAISPKEGFNGGNAFGCDRRRSLRIEPVAMICSVDTWPTPRRVPAEPRRFGSWANQRSSVPRRR